MRDTTQAIVDILAADATVQGLVGQDADSAYRVYGEELKNSVASEMPRAAVIVTRVPGGEDFGHMNLERGVVEVACCGETRKDAMTLRGAVRDALKAVSRRVINGTLVHSVEPKAGQILSTRDQDAKWPMVTEAYQFLVSETVVA